MGSLIDKLYMLDCTATPSEQVALASSKSESEVILWHQRLGHRCEQQLKDMAHKQLVTGMKHPRNAESSFCEGCVEGKMKRKPFKAAWEKFVHVENYNSFTVTYVAQCPQSTS